MDNFYSLEQILKNPKLVENYAKALQDSNYSIRKDVFQLLTNLCGVSEEGLERVHEIINCYQKQTKKRYRFETIVEDLKNATTEIDYQTILITFINCIIVSTPILIDRIRLRNEFKSVNLLPVLFNLRSTVYDESKLGLEINRFEKQLVADEIAMFDSKSNECNIDRNSAIELFYYIFKEVSKNSNEISFLTILQHFYMIDNNGPFSDKIWDIAERFVYLSLSINDSNQNYEQFLKFVQDFGRKTATNFPTSKKTGNVMPPPPPPPPLKAPISDFFADIITKDFRENKRLKTDNKTESSEQLLSPTPSSTLTTTPSATTITETSTTKIEPKLPQQITPKPSLKMKTINWNKIPINRIVGKHNLWAVIADDCRDRCSALNWSEIENLFCQNQNVTLTNASQSNSILASNSNTSGISNDNPDAPDKLKKKESQEIRILEGKKSLNINIFLKQFKCSNDEIVKMIKNGHYELMGSEKLRNLLKILPEFDELELLRIFDGDKSKLGNAEKFVLKLSQLSNYKLRLESMLLKAEFTTNLSFLRPSISSMILAAEDLMTNKELHQVLYMILIAGNFLNSGGYAGDAAGIKLSSLQKITETRANKPNMNLVHYVAIQAEQIDKKLLSFVDKISVIEDAAKITMEQLYNEISTLDARIKTLKKQIDIDLEIRDQMESFLKTAEIEVKILQKKMLQLETIKQSLAEFFCEDLALFKFEECFRIFHGFYMKFRQAIGENQRRRFQEEQMHLRRQQRAELLAMKRKQLNDDMDCDDLLETQIYESMAGNSHKKLSRKSTNGTVGSEEDTSLSGSPYFSRKRYGGGSFNNHVQNDLSKEDKMSPDITPNGSLRRRRNRALADEDDSNLMEFLRSSDQRERKVHGSLDRSWARVQMHAAAERARQAKQLQQQSEDIKETKMVSEPVVVAESTNISRNNTLTQAKEEPEIEMTPKDLRQKIENWLQTTENSPMDSQTNAKVTIVEKENKTCAETKNQQLTSDLKIQDGCDSRKDFIASLANKSADDKVTIYIRGVGASANGSGTSRTATKTRFYTLPRNYQKNRSAVDNSSTTTANSNGRVWRNEGKMANNIQSEDNDDVCGKFDRFSSIRRSKRYKKIISVVPDTKDIQTIKSSDNDEGFEESHSLMSEAASQATSSNSNCEPETAALIVDLQATKKPSKESPTSPTTAKTVGSITKPATQSIPKQPQQTSSPRFLRFLTKPKTTGSTSTKPPTQATTRNERLSSNPVAPASTTFTLRNTSHNNSNTESNCNSKSSLFSSKSSINTINTVRKMPTTPSIIRSPILAKSISASVSQFQSKSPPQPQPQSTSTSHQVNNGSFRKSNSLKTASSSAPSSSSNRTAAKPVTSKSFEPAFMKPTASSATKSHLTRQSYSFRSPLAK